MNYKILGNKNSKETLVFIHGAFCNMKFLEPVAKNFKDYQCLLLDLPGHGDSKVKSEKSVEEYSNKVKSLIYRLIHNDEIAEKVTLIGWSMGGSISLTLAVKQMLEIKKIVLISSSPSWNIPEIPRDKFDFKALALSETTTSSTDKMKEKLNSLLEDYAESLDSCMDDITAVNNFNLINEIKKINIPVLILSGEVDHLALLENQFLMKKTIPDAHLDIALNRAHDYVLESPKDIAQKIKDFFKYCAI